MAKILVVEDSEAVRDEARRILIQAGHEVSIAENGLEGLRILQLRRNFDLILCDVNMPGLDGISMCQQVRALPGFENIPIFVFTSDTALETKEKGRQAKVTAWITKPIVPERLLAGIERVLAMAGSLNA